MSTSTRGLRLLTSLLACSTLSLIACGDDNKPPEPLDVTLMTRNLYLGADIFQLAQAQSAQQVPQVAGQLYMTVQMTNFPERAGAIADEIQAQNPALVGLQEVSLYRTQHPSDFMSNGAVNATDVTYDFLDLLQQRLKERGLDYRVAAQVQNADSELPASLDPNDPSDLTDVRLTDYDVILSRGDVQTSGEVEQNYMNNAQVSVGGGTITFTRGFTKVDADLDGAKFTLVNSHLEGLMPANEQQAHEIVDVLQGYSQPVILVGDLNTGPGTTTPAYGIISDAGYTDAWTVAGSGSGFTCCFGEKLENTDTSVLNQRIDLMFYAGDTAQPISATVVGNELGDRTASGLWPSDHAGTVVTFRVQR